MIHSYHASRQFSAAVKNAAATVIAQYGGGQIQQEPDFTSRLLQQIESDIKGIRNALVQWSGLALTDRGKGAQEKQVGADILGCLDIDFPDVKIRKGFLAQAKITSKLNNSGVLELRDQCVRMLTFTPDAFVFLYSTSDIRVVPASSIASSTCAITNLYSRSIQRFFQDYLTCFVGDTKFNAATETEVRRLIEEYKTRNAIAIRIGPALDAGVKP